MYEGKKEAERGLALPIWHPFSPRHRDVIALIQQNFIATTSYNI